MFHSMTAKDVDDVIRALRKVLNHYGKNSESAPALKSRRSETDVQI
jgi:hypothetical protein